MGIKNDIACSESVAGLCNVLWDGH